MFGRLLVFYCWTLINGVRPTTVHHYETGSSSPADQVDNSTVVWPQRLDSNGRPLPFNKRHFRSKIDVSDWGHPVRYRIKAFDATMILDLLMDTRLVTPQFMVQSVRRNMGRNESWIRSVDPKEMGIKCLYNGKVLGDPKSKVVVSLCHGMMGQIHSSKGDFTIMPRNRQSHTAAQTSLVAHLMTKLRFSQFFSKDEYREEQDVGHDHGINIKLPHHFHHHHRRRHHRHHFNQLKSSYSEKDSSQRWARRRRRAKRSFSLEQHIEVMVVADHRMAEFYGEDLQLYILTLMSIVALIYRDVTIGNLVNVAVVKLLVMDQQEDEIILKSSNVTEILKEFCRWQQSHNIPDDSHPYHHDTAILLTRKDICLETPPSSKCEILGLAEVGKMCDHRKSCSVVEDSGLSSAFTIAHELGHVLNIPHDNEKACLKPNKNFTMYNIMSAVMGEETDPWSWSKCSRMFLTEFLNSDLGKCILDKPVNVVDDKKKPRHLQYQPGELYDATKQCELLYSPGYKPCYDITQRPCQMLWCEGPKPEDGCLSKHSPWADGTDCGLNMWCLRGECVRKNHRELIPVNGNWGEWSEYGTCSRSCGGGIAQSERLCDNPVPNNGGRYCVGRRRKYKSCSTKDCPLESKSFRDVQCEEYNGSDFDLKNIPIHPQWIPKFYTEVPEEDMCRLVCSVIGTSMYHVLKDRVIDGTPCKPGSFDICVNGNCVKAGCDHILGSDANVDMCNVCQGDNSTCRIVSGTFNTSDYGYNLVKRIPAGAGNILIEQRGYQGLLKDDNYLALKSVDDEYILNGKFILRSFELKLYYGGVEIEYSGSNTTVEIIKTSSRLQKDLIIEVLTVGHLYPPDIKYQYMVPSEDDNEYDWHLEDHWSECSKVCKGEQYRHVVCVRIYDRVIVSDDHCKYRKRPDDMAQVCNLNCDLRWRVTQESECSARCGKGTKRRIVKCYQVIEKGRSHSLQDRYCEEREPKPQTEVECVGDCADIFWNFGEWSECSKSCGGGVQSRVVKCTDTLGRKLDDQDCKETPKQTVRMCNAHDCPRWEVGDWSPCSVSCGRGLRHRAYWCQHGNQVVNENYCDKTSVPESKEHCHLSECTLWDVGSWGPCSVSCGVGFSRRTARCVTEEGDELSRRHCDRDTEPSLTIECDLPACTTTVASAGSTSSPLVSTTTDRPDPVPSKTISDQVLSTPPIVGSVRTNKVSPPPSRSQIHVDYIPQNLSPLWKSGSWTKCSRSCGDGLKERYVACHDRGSNKRLPDNMCDASLKSPSQESCRDRPCGYWRTGEWSQCSQSCGGGYKQRQVKCLDLDQLESDSCDPESRPTGTIRCNVEPCPEWSIGQWSKCSASCGEGNSTRKVVCKSFKGQLLPDLLCDAGNRPESAKSCKSVESCVDKSKEYYWKKELWSKCSVACGKGKRHRTVACVVRGEKTKVADDLCPKRKPKSMRRCRRGSCPKWRRAGWTKCSSACNGTQERIIVCRRKRRKVESYLCSNRMQQPPVEKRSCNVKHRCFYRWKSVMWSKCSKPCGVGIAHRRVSCVDRMSKKVSDIQCTRRKPRSKMRCNTHTCGYTWTAEHWSSCTHTCDVGIQTRDVTCHRVNDFGWIIPRPVPHDKCNKSTRPQSVRRCNYGSCHHQVNVKGVWRVGPWRSCSAVCGRGISRRKIRCYAANGSKLSHKGCDKRLRPPRKRSCWLRPCEAISCLDVKRRSKTREDGEQMLYVHGKTVKIYCAGMNTSSPREYLTLPTGLTENFSEIFPKRLVNPDSCPSADRCDCTDDYKLRAGFTAFDKIRINVTSLKVITNDYKFSRSLTKKHIRYGEAGDCYSRQECPQGRFSINLQRTDFVLGKNVRWNSHGNRATFKIHKSDHGTVVKGKCGGYCGQCYPEFRRGGLYLDVAPPS
ncbi:ADAMTS9 (predicted) [Pycnogonum litorale]